MLKLLYVRIYSVICFVTNLSFSLIWGIIVEFFKILVSSSLLNGSFFFFLINKIGKILCGELEIQTFFQVKIIFCTVRNHKIYDHSKVIGNHPFTIINDSFVYFSNHFRHSQKSSSRFPTTLNSLVIENSDQKLK